MDVNRWISITEVLLLCAFSGCSRDQNIRHGSAVHSVSEIFPIGSHEFILAQAAGRGDLSAINREISLGTSVNTVGRNGITPLWWTAWAGNYTGFAALLKAGANTNLNPVDESPLMNVVCYIQDTRFLELALKYGGDPNVKDPTSGETPLFVALINGTDIHIDLLLQAGADVNAQLPISKETLPIAAIGARGDYKLVWKFLQKGADYNLKTFHGRTLADRIAFCNIDPNNDENYMWREKVIDYLKSKGVEVHRPEDESPRMKPLPNALKEKLRPLKK